MGRSKKYDISGSGNNGSRTTAKDEASERLIQLTCFHGVTSESIGELQRQTGHPDISSRLQASIGTVVTPAVVRPIKTPAAATSHTLLAESTGTCCGWPDRHARRTHVRPRNGPTYRSRLGSASTDDRRQPGGRPVALRRRLDVVKISTSVWRRQRGAMRCEDPADQSQHLRNRLVTSIRHRSSRLHTISC